ncbi:hypothetical protein Hanom_Chr08g00689771 [Helianthus anomalus]
MSSILFFCKPSLWLGLLIGPRVMVNDKIVGMVGRGLGVWVDMWSLSPPLVSDVSVGYGGAWLGQVYAPRYALANKPIRAGHIESRACPTPGLRLPLKGPHPNPSPPGVVTWAFLSNPRPNPRPIPHSLRKIFASLWSTGNEAAKNSDLVTN